LHPLPVFVLFVKKTATKFADMFATQNAISPASLSGLRDDLKSFVQCHFTGYRFKTGAGRS
jgi:hypothetical protein